VFGDVYIPAVLIELGSEQLFSFGAMFLIGFMSMMHISLIFTILLKNI
jgi:hypothetical protein